MNGGNSNGRNDRHRYALERCSSWQYANYARLCTDSDVLGTLKGGRLTTLISLKKGYLHFCVRGTPLWLGIQEE